MKYICSFLLISALATLFACNSNDDSPSPEESCVEGEFIQRYPYCQALVGLRNWWMYDIKILENDKYDTVKVIDLDLPVEFRIPGQKFYFKIDSVGQVGSCLFIVSPPPPPLRISNVSLVPCDDENR